MLLHQNQDKQLTDWPFVCCLLFVSLEEDSRLLRLEEELQQLQQARNHGNVSPNQTLHVSESETSCIHYTPYIFIDWIS